MSTHFNSALRQSTAIRKDLEAYAEACKTSSPSPAAQGTSPSWFNRCQITTSLTSFSRTLDDYARSISAELVPEKKTRDTDRLTNFRSELLDYKARFANLKREAEEQQAQSARSELLGHRRPHGASHTPENPYSDAAVASSARERPGASAGGSNSLFRVNNPNFAPSAQNPYSSYQSPYALDTGSGDGAREQHALREQNFFGQANQTLDEYIERGRAVLGDLGEQKDMLKGTQRKLYSVANTLGVSGDTIRMVERRAKQDKWIFWSGVLVFVVFVWLVLHYLR